MPFTAHSGARIYWRLEGDRSLPPLVLLHSIGTEKGLYDRAAEFLMRSHALLRIDLRGHGASDAPRGDYSLSLMAGDVMAVMDDAGLDRVVLCGTSLGGMVALQFALDNPARLSGMVLACTSPGMSPGFWPSRIALVCEQGMAAAAQGWDARHFSEGFMAAHPELTQTQLHSVQTIDPIGYCGAAAAIRDMDIERRLGKIGVPTLLIAGRQDTATPFEGHGDRIAAGVPGCAVELMPTGHLACVEQPERFAELVARFAARCA